MKTITEKEYRDYLELDNKIHKLIEEKTKQLSLIQYGKLPKGVYRDCEFTEKDCKICIQFESYSCGETDYDTFYLPLEFLFDESYPEKYKLIWEEEKRKEKEESDRKNRLEEDHRKEVLENYEKKEYERLKSKFEKN